MPDCNTLACSKGKEALGKNFEDEKRAYKLLQFPSIFVIYLQLYLKKEYFSNVFWHEGLKLV